MKNGKIAAQNESHVIGVLSGWDRLVFHGCCPLLAYLDGMLMWTLRMDVLLKDYSEWALSLSDAIRRACLAECKFGLTDATGWPANLTARELPIDVTTIVCLGSIISTPRHVALSDWAPLP